MYITYVIRTENVAAEGREINWGGAVRRDVAGRSWAGPVGRWKCGRLGYRSYTARSTNQRYSGTEATLPREVGFDLTYGPV